MLAGVMWQTSETDKYIMIIVISMIVFCFRQRS